jgi:hypothetical protein
MFALVKNESVTNQQTQETSEVQVIKLFSPYTIWEDKNGTQYSPDYLLGLTPSQKQDLGIYDVAYAARPNDRFYIVAENAPTFDQNEKIVKITYTSTAKDLEDSEPDAGGLMTLGLKSQYITQLKAEANAGLAETDWMLVRKIERDIDVPAEVTAARQATITAVNSKVAAITAVTTVEELIALVG